MKVGDEVYISYPFAVQFETKGTAVSVKGKKPLN